MKEEKCSGCGVVFYDYLFIWLKKKDFPSIWHARRESENYPFWSRRNHRRRTTNYPILENHVYPCVYESTPICFAPKNGFTAGVIRNKTLVFKELCSDISDFNLMHAFCLLTEQIFYRCIVHLMWWNILVQKESQFHCVGIINDMIINLLILVGSEISAVFFKTNCEQRVRKVLVISLKGCFCPK